MNRLVLFVATGGGFGRLPGPSGTWGTLPGLPLAWWLTRYGVGWQILACALMILAAIPICSAAERIFRRMDDRRIVLDEMVTFPLCVIGLPLLDHWWLLIPTFVAHRLFDILKPPPAFQAQSLQDGMGIVADDTISSLYALAVNWAFYGALVRFGWLQQVAAPLS